MGERLTQGDIDKIKKRDRVPHTRCKKRGD